MRDDDERRWDDGLKPKERLFVLYYCCHAETFFNASAAYRKAYSKMDRKTRKMVEPDAKSCESCGSRLKGKARIRDAIRLLLAETQAETDEENARRLLNDLATLAFFNPADILNAQGGLKVKKLDTLGDKAKAIAQIYPGKMGTRVVLVDRSKYMELLSRYLELVRPEQQVEVNMPVIELPAKAASDEEWNEEG